MTKDNILTSCIILGLLCIVYIVFKILYNRLNKVQSLHSKFILRLIKGVFVVAGVVLIGQQFTWSEKLLGVVLTSSSLLVAVLGFAAQQSLSDIINGVFISIFKPFDIGDRIKLVSNNITGTIEDISLRHTIIRTFSNSRMIIPNSVMNKEMIENSHFKDSVSGNFIDIVIDYDSDVDLAKKLMAEAIENHPLVIDTRTEEAIQLGKPILFVSVRDLSLNGVILRATIWTKDIDDNFVACSDLRLEIKKLFDKHNIQIAYTNLKVIMDCENKLHIDSHITTKSNSNSNSSKINSGNTSKSRKGSV